MTSCIVHVIMVVRIKLATWKILDVGRKRKASVRDLEGDIGTKKKRPVKPHRALCKSAKRSVSIALEQATAAQSNFDDVVAAVLQELDAQLRIRTFPCRAAGEVELETPSVLVTIELAAILYVHCTYCYVRWLKLMFANSVRSLTSGVI